VRASLARPFALSSLSLCHDLVLSVPCVFNYDRRNHPPLIGPATSKALEPSCAAGKFPCAFDSHFITGSDDSAFKSAEVAVTLRMIVDEVAALRAASRDQLSRAPISDLAVVPLLVR